MDTLQAAILNYRLDKLPDVIAKRRTNAALYQGLLRHETLYVPPCRNEEFNTFHTFVVQLDRRDELQAYLRDCGIKTAIHYPVPIHLQPAARALGHKRGDFPVTERQAERILTLPVNQYMSAADVEAVAGEVMAFLDR
jgi:dTDP-4-amino-4,6-dideoxygalactose transaminase